MGSSKTSTKAVNELAKAIRMNFIRTQEELKVYSNHIDV